MIYNIDGELIQNRRNTVILPQVFISSTMTSAGQGLAKVGDYYLISNAGTDSYSSGGSTVNIDIYNSSFTNVGHLRHNLGHGSGICYNSTFDSLIMGNGNANVPPRFDILLNASANVNLAVGGSEPEYFFGNSNVISIYLSKNGQELIPNADGAEWCVAGNDRLVILSVRNADKERVFLLGMLGVGSSDFSQDENGYGTYISGKSNSELNGTLKIIESYTNIDSTITSAQGMAYDKGFLIVSSSTSNCLIYKLGFFEEGCMIVDNYKIPFYNANGTEMTCEPEGVLRVGDGHFYCATTKGVIEFYI